MTKQIFSGVGLVLVLALPVLGQIQTLTDGNSTVKIDPNNSAGNFQWQVNGPNGTFDHLSRQWFWYRIGNSPEASIDTIDATPLIETLGTNFVRLTYTLPGVIEFRISFELAGGANGQFESSLTEGIKVTNLSNSSVDLNVFQYADFDLFATPNDDNGQFTSASRIEQTDTTSGNGIAETVATGGSDIVGREVQLVGGGGDILSRLTDGAATNLGNVNGPVTGNVAWSFQWAKQLGSGQSLTFSKDKKLMVPAPGAAILGLLGVGLALCRRGRRHAD